MTQTIQGFGLGLRPKHYQDILNEIQTQSCNPVVSWFEILSENYLIKGGRPTYYLEAIAEHYPIVMHGVSLSLGNAEPLDLSHVMALKQLSQKINAEWISDHLCWTGIQGINSHDLLPLPLTEESLSLVTSKVNQAQDILEQPLLIENPSSYLTFKQDSLTEWEFLNELHQQTQCKLLLDINNVYVSSLNHNFSAKTFIQSLKSESIQQVHLAGHSQGEYCLIDTHDTEVPKPVLDLYRFFLENHGFVPTMIERDDNIPDYVVLVKELEKIQCITAETEAIPIGISA